MFGGGYSNPYDDIVAKTTDENLTTENWELILNLCDKVDDEGQEGAHNVIAAVLKRLAHRNPNVQLYALSLAEALSKNCGIELHREIASKAFTQGLEKLVTDRNTHDKVRKRALALVATWTEDFEHDTSLGIMQDCYDSLAAKNYKFESSQEPLPPTVDDEIRRKEEEELQRVLEMSMQDKGGRNQWSSYSSVGAGASGSGSSSNRPAATTQSSTVLHQPTYQAGYAPGAAQIRSPSPDPSPPAAVVPTQAPPSTHMPAQSPSPAPSTEPSAIVTRVRALHTFEPTEPGELAFEKGDIIKVVDRGYKDWWRGQLKGRTGIFPVNYVEALPEPTADELAKEAQQEAAVFAQAVNVEKLLNMLRSLDPQKDNLADDEEIQELYRSSMALRPKIVKLIDKYSQKRADLVSMNETFVRARTIFDRMMEESLSRHTGMYEQGYGQYGPRPDPRGPQYSYQQSQYSAFPTPQQQQPGLGQGFPGGAPPAQQRYPSGPQQPIAGYPTSAPSTPGPQQGYPQGFPPQQQPPVGYQQPQQQQPQQAPQSGYQPQPPPQSQQQQQQQPVYASQQQGGYAAGTFAPPYAATQPQQTQQGATPQLQPQQQEPRIQSPVPHQQPQPIQPQQVQPQPQAAQPQQPQPQHTQLQPTQPQQAQPQQIEQTQTQQSANPPAAAATAAATPGPQNANANPGGPPYVFDPNATYADPNVQAWAQYYARGGKELAGAVYFISVPGVTDGATATAPHPTASPLQQQHQPQSQQIQAQSQHQQAQQLQHASAVELTREPSISLPDPYASQAGDDRNPQRQSSLPSPYPVENPASAGLNRTSSLSLTSDPSTGVSSSMGTPQSPAGQQPGQQAPFSGFGGVGSPAQQQPQQSPPAASSTPSWVLPKQQPRNVGPQLQQDGDDQQRGYGASPYGAGVQLRDGPMPATTA